MVGATCRFLINLLLLKEAGSIGNIACTYLAIADWIIVEDCNPVLLNR